MICRQSVRKHFLFRRIFSPVHYATFVSNHRLLQESENVQWISENRLFQKFPRLRFLEICKFLNQIKQSLSYIIVSGLHRNNFVMSRVLYFCVISSQNLDFGVLIFNHLPNPNLFSWNTMIRAFPDNAVCLYCEMLRRGILPDKYTLSFLIKAHEHTCNLESGKLIHGHAIAMGFISDCYVRTEVVNMYLGCGCTNDARMLFDEMHERDIVSWTSMISGLVGQGCFKEVLEIFNRMRNDCVDVKPNIATMVSVMSACSNLGSIDTARNLHAYLEKVGLQTDIFVSNSLIDLYAKCGDLGCAKRAFEKIVERDLYSWTSMISGLAIHGYGKQATCMFLEMIKSGIAPDSISFIAVLSACSHGGLVKEGLQIFESMVKEFNIKPELKHYGCMVDLLGRTGFLLSAYKLVMEMPVKHNLAILGSLLSSCRIHGNLELGEIVSKEIEMSSEKERCGTPVLMSNIYAKENRWNEVIHIRKEMNTMRIKPPGRSWIELKGVVHDFTVENPFHPKALDIYSVLDKI